MERYRCCVRSTLDDRLNLNRFPSDEYYHLPASSDNTIQPFTLDPELHIIVSANAPDLVTVEKLDSWTSARVWDAVRQWTWIRGLWLLKMPLRILSLSTESSIWRYAPWR